MTPLLTRPFTARRDPSLPRRFRTRWLVGVAVALVVTVLITWVVAFSTILGVRIVQVRGTQLLTADTVRRAAAVPPGTPLVRLDTGAIRARVMTLPEVASAAVETSYPSTVVVTIVERRPVGYVVAGAVAGAASIHLLDRTGRQYRVVAAKPAGLPRLVFADGAGARATATAVAAVAGGLPAAVLHRVRSIQALDPDAITLVLRSGTVVAWGSADRTAEKARILPVLLQQPGKQFDLTDPAQPVVR